ncbi:MAG: hypothetical protein WD751_11615 [Anaerolineales bacterium]
MAKRRARSRNRGLLTLSAPMEITWVIAVIAGGLGMLAYFGVFSIGVETAVLLMIGFLILAVATAVKGL